MKADFSSLFRLFDSIEKQVEGRGSSQPPEEVRVMLEGLMSGTLSSKKERGEAFELLRKEPGWLEWFAEQLKARRKNLPGLQ